MANDLALWADGQRVGTLSHAAADDRWMLAYEPAWVAAPGAFPLSQALPMPPGAPVPGALKRFIENLLPEGRALDICATTYHVSKSNVFGLIHALGTETAGAFRFLPVDMEMPPHRDTPPREVTLAELNERMEARRSVPFVVWDGKVRISIAGYQDKLLVYVDPERRMFLVEPPLASTHILKPEPDRDDMPHLVVNEHFCMSLARRMGLPVAEVGLLRAPRPLLIVKRFDREAAGGPGGPEVRRLHVIDACQASDLPVSCKYERNFGNGEMVKNIREGVSFEVLFQRVDQTVNKAAARLTMLRWALFQFLIGNTDAHGKNFSFFARREGLEPAPWYDLVSVVQYPGIDHELAMAFGDAFTLEEVEAFPLADFARRCGIQRRLLKREATRMAKLATDHAAAQTAVADYVGEETAFAASLRDFIVAQAARLDMLALKAVEIRDVYL